MDKIITSSTWKSILDRTWKDKIEDLLKIKDTFPEVRKISLYLPFCSYVEEGCKSTKFAIIDDKFHINSMQKLTDFMSLSLKQEYGKYRLVLSLGFYGTFVPQMVLKKPGFFYKIDSNSCVVQRYVATTNPKKIEEQSLILYNECLRFSFIYFEFKQSNLQVSHLD